MVQVLNIKNGRSQSSKKIPRPSIYGFFLHFPNNTHFNTKNGRVQAISTDAMRTFNASGPSSAAATGAKYRCSQPSPAARQPRSWITRSLSCYTGQRGVGDLYITIYLTLIYLCIFNLSIDGLSSFGPNPNRSFYY